MKRPARFECWLAGASCLALSGCVDFIASSLPAVEGAQSVIVGYRDDDAFVFYATDPRSDFEVPLLIPDGGSLFAAYREQPLDLLGIAPGYGRATRAGTGVNLVRGATLFERIANTGEGWGQVDSNTLPNFFLDLPAFCGDEFECLQFREGNLICTDECPPRPEPVRPSPPLGPAPPDFSQCPSHWVTTQIDDPSHPGGGPSFCVPPNCGAGEVSTPSGCAPVTGVCGAGPFPEPYFPTDRRVHVLAGVAPGGDGSLDAPFPNLMAALAAVRTATDSPSILLGAGSYSGTQVLPFGVKMIGMCEQTVVLGAFRSAEDLVIKQMILTSPGTAARSDRTLTLENVAVESTSESAAAEAVFALRSLVARSVSVAGQIGMSAPDLRLHSARIEAKFIGLRLDPGNQAVLTDVTFAAATESASAILGSRASVDAERIEIAGGAYGIRFDDGLDDPFQTELILTDVFTTGIRTLRGDDRWHLAGISANLARRLSMTRYVSRDNQVGIYGYGIMDMQLTDIVIDKSTTPGGRTDDRASGIVILGGTARVARAYVARSEQAGLDARRFADLTVQFPYDSGPLHLVAEDVFIAHNAGDRGLGIDLRDGSGSVVLSRVHVEDVRLAGIRLGYDLPERIRRDLSFTDVRIKNVGAGTHARAHGVDANGEPALIDNLRLMQIAIDDVEGIGLDLAVDGAAVADLSVAGCRDEAIIANGSRVEMNRVSVAAEATSSAPFAVSLQLDGAIAGLILEGPFEFAPAQCLRTTPPAGIGGVHVRGGDLSLPGADLKAAATLLRLEPLAQLEAQGAFTNAHTLISGNASGLGQAIGADAFLHNLCAFSEVGDQ